jgi:hypothetical protein
MEHGLPTSDIAPEDALQARTAEAAPWIALAIMVAYFFAVALLAPATPFADDADIAHESASFGAAKSPAAAWTALSAQHDEHRPIVVRLVFWAAAALPGPTSYRLIALTGGLFLVAAYWLLAREARRIAAPRAILIVLAALLFNDGAAESSLWATAAVANFGVLAMVIAMLAMLGAGGAWAAVAIVPALFAVGLQGNGLAALLVGIGMLMFNRRWGLATVWGLVLAGVVVWYFTGYVRPLEAPDPTRLVSRLPEIMVYALAFCGSAAAFAGEPLGVLNVVSVTVATLLGACLLLATMWGALRGGLGLDRSGADGAGRGRWLLWLNVFVFLTATLAALSRIDHGVEQALDSRYHINSCLMLAATLLYLLEGGGPAAAALRQFAPSMAVIGVVYVLATAPIAAWMHNLHNGDAPPTAPAATGDGLAPDPKWNLDRAALAPPPQA